MKKILACTVASVLGLSVFAASYTNNTYQKLAKEYTQKAERALDAGEYVLAEEYAAKAKENAELSDTYISHMLQKESAEKDLNLARNRLAYVESINGKENFPIAYDSASKSLAQAEDAFAKEEWNAASSYSKQVLDALAEIKEVTPLPKYYVVNLGSQIKTASGTSLEDLTFTTILICGKTFTKQTRIPFQIQRIQT